jgi:5-amino-6-(5-phospho-D-ribitylamino)uracil phosphatase
MSVGEIVESFRKKLAAGSSAKLPATRHEATHNKKNDIKTSPGKIRMIALDLDGTLLAPRAIITPRVHQAVRQAIDNGVRVILATARPPRSVRFYHRALKLNTPIVSHNGALIWDEKKRQVIHHESLSHTLVWRIINYVRHRCPDVITSVEIIDKLYSDHFGVVPMDALPPGCVFNPDVIAELESFLRVPVTRLMLHGRPSLIDELNYLLPQRFGEQVALFRSDSRLLLLLAPDINKAVALERVAKSYDITSNEVLAIGDSPNDLPMLQWAAIGVAMANSPDSVKRAVTCVVPSNENDGVAIALQRYVL